MTRNSELRKGTSYLLRKETLKNGPYRPWRNSMISWLAFAAVGLALGVIGMVFGESEAIGKIILMVVPICLGAVGIGGWLRELSIRINVMGTIETYLNIGDGYWYWCIDARLSKDDWIRIRHEFMRKAGVS